MPFFSYDVMHCPRVTDCMVAYAVAEFGIWGPYFFEEDNVTVTVNSDRYCEMLETFLRPKLNMPHDMDNGFNRMGQQPTLPDVRWGF